MVKKGFSLLPVLLIVFLIFVVLGYKARDSISRFLFFLPRPTGGVQEVKNGVSQKSVPTGTQNLEIVAQNLEIPWEIVFLPSGEMLVTERSGKLLKIGAEKKVIQEVAGVAHVGEGGLLGVALHPKFSENNYLYLYSTTRLGGEITNRLERYKLVGETLSDRQVILEGIKGSSNHDGGRIVFGPDGYLYVTTGDAGSANLAQDKNSLNGKILRIRDDGAIPSDNPFGNAVYSLGHRNPQGLAWDKNGVLWETEHGPSGSETGFDEVNIIIKGGNFGWPLIKGAEMREGLIAPVVQSGSEDTWAPSGMAYWEGSLFFSGLRGEALYEAKILPGNRVDLVTHFKSEWGRVRAVSLGPDGYLYISTSNRDGRGQVKAEDDKIIKINPRMFR